MPELPEVETITMGLNREIKGRRVQAVEVLEPKSLQSPKSILTEVIIEHRISSIERRAKVLIWNFDSGYSLLFHLKMTGQLVVEKQGKKQFGGGHPTKSLDDLAKLPDKSTRLIFYLDDSTKVFFNDQRKFGWVRIIKTDELLSDPFLAKVGPEPLSQDFNLGYFKEVLRRRNSIIKATLLDQSVLAGLGNIYVDESLHLARIHPSRRASSLTDKEISSLRRAIRQVLTKAISKGGTSLSNYVNAHGQKGDYLLESRVFSRQGEKCPVCGDTIIKVRLAGRGTHICPTCQSNLRET